MSSKYWRFLQVVCVFLHTVIALKNKTDCVENVDGKIIDLRRLDINLPICSNNKTRKFSIQLCGDNNVCGKNITACEITDSIVVPLSSKESQGVFINDNKVVIHGSFKNKQKRFILDLNCNWETDTSNLTYHEVQNQGRKYSFQMESKVGCVKNIPSCIINDGKYEYDLTPLNKPEGWDVSRNGKLFINICGPLKVPDKNVKCKESESQSCDISKDLSMGSILSHIELEDKTIKLKIYDGNVCSWTTLTKYSTIITFYCSFDEKGPVFEKYSECVNYITWHSPMACPKLNDTCNLKLGQKSNCTHKIGDTVINLNNLKGSVHDEKSNKDYTLNVCELLIDDTKCLKTSYVLMKDKNEPSIKYQTTSLGRNKTISQNQNGFLVKFTDGDLCSNYSPVKTIVHLKCSDKETLYLVNNNECTKEFLWNSPDVCGKSKNETKCEIQTDLGNILALDFFPPKNFEINNNKTYQINICEDNYTTCLNDTCISSVLSRTYITSTSPNYILFYLNKNCKSTVNDFNKVILNLFCDDNAYEDLYEFKKKENCILNISLRSSYVCRYNQIVKAKHYEHLYNKNETCHFSSKETGYQLDINKLNIIEIPLLKNCPLIYVNHTTKSIKLIYTTDIACILNSYPRRVNYTVLVQCFKETDTVFKSSEVCSDTSQVKSNEACKLFLPLKNPELNSTLPGIIGGISAVVILVVATIFVFIWLKKRTRRTGSYLGLYVKNSDL